MDLLDATCSGDDRGDVRVLGAPGDRHLGQRASQLLGDGLQLAHLLIALGVGEQVSQPLIPRQRGTRAIGDTVEVLAGQQTRTQRAPGGEAQPDAFVKGGVLRLHPVPPEQVVLGLFHHRLMEVVAIGDVPGLAQRGSRPLRGSPVERLATGDDVGHGPHCLFDRGFRIRSMTVEKIDKIEAQPLQRCVDGLQEILAIEGVPHVGPLVEPPEQLGGEHVAVARPPEGGDRLAHDALRLTAGVGLGIVEEVDSGIVCGAQALLGQIACQLGPERHPRAKGQHTDLQPRPTQTSILHLHSVSSPIDFGDPTGCAALVIHTWRWTRRPGPQ